MARKPRTLKERVASLERRIAALERKKRPIGFALDSDEVRGHAVEQHDEEREETQPLELRGRR